MTWELKEAQRNSRDGGYSFGWGDINILKISVKSQLRASCEIVTPKSSRELAQVGLSKIRFFMGQEKRLLQHCPRVGDDITSLPPSQHGTLASQAKSNWEAQWKSHQMTLKADEFTLVRISGSPATKKKQINVVKKAKRHLVVLVLIPQTFVGNVTKKPCRAWCSLLTKPYLTTWVKVDIIHSGTECHPWCRYQVYPPSSPC